MTTLITGATGFVGSAVLRAAVERGIDARVLARPGSDRRNIDGVNCEITEGDLNDPGSICAALQGCSSLVHVAADYRLWTLTRPSCTGRIVMRQWICFAPPPGQC